MRRGIEIALTSPYGPVRLGVPSGFLDHEIEAPIAATESEYTTYDNEGAYGRATELLAEARRPVVYAGGGTRRTAEGPRVVRALAEALDAPVLCSHKGKGVFPEDDPRFLGVTGSHTPAGVRRVLDRADCVLALCTDFDGVTTGHWELPMGESVIQIDLDPGAIGRSYDAAVGIVADATDAGDRLVGELGAHDAPPTERWDGERVASSVREEYFEQLGAQELFEAGPPLPTPAVLRAVRETIPRGTSVVTDVGGFRLWSMQAFDAYDPQAFVTAGSWAGMGTGLPGAIGAGLANPEDQIVCLTGDGGLMMCTQELHTAAEHDLDLVVLV